MPCVNNTQTWTSYLYPGIITSHPTKTEDYSIRGKFKGARDPITGLCCILFIHVILWQQYQPRREPWSAANCVESGSVEPAAESISRAATYENAGCSEAVLNVVHMCMLHISSVGS